ncbi:hypothetical protein R50345_15980 [Paenibacillus sp. FSL R5-0345]|uniref:hypothetical protein n=1 Tax=Paenibacillus sp. FSL R5-0345 TaxID=1536770 RepID=UPI0004F7FB1C|nr:hypothetical protein [Paenibacillus sp. FSL R5-0345]AIQ35985.1 hypothetical protein R50345_15980 [Paenibacillus sp. FSL R5-0345]
MDEFGYMVGDHKRNKMMKNEQRSTELAESEVNLEPEHERLFNPQSVPPRRKLASSTGLKNCTLSIPSRATGRWLRL